MTCSQFDLDSLDSHYYNVVCLDWPYHNVVIVLPIHRL